MKYFSYKFFYEDDNDITFLCMGKNLDSDIAFSFIADIKKKFLLSYDNNQIKNAFSYQLKDFSNEIKKMMISYGKNPISKIKLLQNSVSKTQSILFENVQQLMERDTKLDLIAQKSNRLTETSDSFMKNIHEIKKRQKMKKYKLYGIVGAFVLVVIIFIYLKFS
jgi:hypothetical protein